jgi:hypothetical protein
VITSDEEGFVEAIERSALPRTVEVPSPGGMVGSQLAGQVEQGLREEPGSGGRRWPTTEPSG